MKRNGDGEILSRGGRPVVVWKVGCDPLEAQRIWRRSCHGHGGHREAAWVRVSRQYRIFLEADKQTDTRTHT
ncbi:hypothetical protein E2C01_047826 [Portunus trituberculatus]|uniref:Uncharacterized protein n=1 Tax=Portunus trituberculatus TaxID=210409 RepID=A0A5B7G9J2_PORTR|nr:hypothetical protein [Portunus trituberculatus]